MNSNTTAVLICTIVAVAIISAGVGVAYAYSSSVSSDSNSISADYLSIDIYSGDDPISWTDIVSFSVNPSAPVYQDGRIEYLPANPLTIRVTGDGAYNVDTMGAFTVASSNPAYAAAIKAVTIVFETDVDCVLGGNHANLAPGVFNGTLVETGTGTGVFVKEYTIQKVYVYLIDGYQESTLGNAYVCITGEPGSDIPVSNLVGPNKLDFTFHVAKHA